jgi:hypothetical protein
VCDLHSKIDGRRTRPGVQYPGSTTGIGRAYVQSQIHAGWTALAERYDDGGYTGANPERPALRKLLADIELVASTAYSYIRLIGSAGRCWISRA